MLEKIWARFAASNERAVKMVQTPVVCPKGLAPDAPVLALTNVSAGDLPARIATPYGLPADKPDREITKRLVAAYRHARGNTGKDADGAWKIILANGQFKLLDKAIADEDYDYVEGVLTLMFQKEVLRGIFLGSTKTQTEAPYVFMIQIYDTIVSLAKALGIMQISSPLLNGTLKKNVLDIDPEKVLDAIAEFLGYDLAPPQVGGLSGISYKGNLIWVKNFYQLYMAHRLSTLPVPEVTGCLEIGGGAGMCAHCAFKTLPGMRHYCIIDLPVVNMFQGYVLLNSDLADCVQLYGESEPAAAQNERCLKILPTFAAAELPAHSYDIAVNQDSFPEMSEESVRGYIGVISKAVKYGLLSINHEHQINFHGHVHGVVNRIMRGYPEFSLAYRAPYWMRSGYVEEFFRLSANK